VAVPALHRPKTQNPAEATEPAGVQSQKPQLFLPNPLNHLQPFFPPRRTPRPEYSWAKDKFMATPAQIEANRANALLSGGPVTEEGRATSSHNAVKFGLTGQTVLLKTDDVELYKSHVQYYVDKFQPANQDERIRVQDIADTEWRLLRIPSSEAAILALGRVKLAALVAREADQQAREQMLEAEVLLTYRKDLSNLSLQHCRLTRHRLNIAKELDEMQSRRRSTERQKIRRAAEYYICCQLDPDWTFNPPEIGFEFSLDEMFTQVATIESTKERDEFPEVAIPIRARRLKEEYAAEFAKKKAA
jgi:hypothetical protein